MLSTAFAALTGWLLPYVATALGLLGLAGGAWLKGRASARRQQDQDEARALRDKLAVDQDVRRLPADEQRERLQRWSRP